MFCQLYSVIKFLSFLLSPQNVPHRPTLRKHWTHDTSSLFNCCSRPNEMSLPAITQWERPQPAMHVPYLDPHIATSSFPVHVSYTNGQCIHVHDGGWGVGCVRARRTSNMHIHVRNCIFRIYTHTSYYMRIPYLQRPSYYIYNLCIPSV